MKSRPLGPGPGVRWIPQRRNLEIVEGTFAVDVADIVPEDVVGRSHELIGKERIGTAIMG